MNDCPSCGQDNSLIKIDLMVYFCEYCGETFDKETNIEEEDYI